MGRRQRLRRVLLRRRSGQALLGALIVVGLLTALAAGLGGLAIEGRMAGGAARDQITAQSMAEMGLNLSVKVLRDVVDNGFVANLETVQDSRAQAWVANSGSPCTWSGIVGQLGDMLYHFSPLYPGTVPDQAQTPTPQNTASYVRPWNRAAGPGGTYTWQATVGIEAVPSPCPTWVDNGVQRVMTFPISAFGFAWVWGPEGQLLGELTDYGPSQTPGYVVMTYPDCPAYFSPAACHLPTSVQVSIPVMNLLWDDPNVTAPAEP